MPIITDRLVKLAHIRYGGGGHAKFTFNKKNRKDKKQKTKKTHFGFPTKERKFINMFDHGRIHHSLTNENWTIFIPQFFSLKLKLKVGHKSLRRSL